MKTMEFPLNGEMGENKPFVRAYLLDPVPDGPDSYSKYPAMVVFPGGGYRNLSPREADVIAFPYTARGFQTFVVNYTLLPETYPQPLLDAANAMALIRDHAQEWNIQPDQIAIVGFSAGGHLCAALSTFWNGTILREHGFDADKIRPNAAVLCYAPVECGHGRDDFGKNFLGVHYDDPEYRKLVNIPQYVGSQNPPTFFFHTFADEKVPVENALSMAKALAENDVPIEVHIYPNGKHGLALSNRVTWYGHMENIIPEAAAWVDQSISWLSRTFGILE